MRTRPGIFLLLIAAAAGTGLAEKLDLRSVDQRYKHAREAYQSKDFSAAVQDFRWLAALFPDEPGIRYELARALIRAGLTKESLAQLEGALELGGGVGAADDPAFDSVRGSEEFRAAAAKIEALKKPVGSAEAAFLLKERDLIPEGIAYDPVDDRFYLGSLYKRKIVSIDRDGTVRDFATKESGLWSVLGLRVDPARRILWANSWNDRSGMIDPGNAIAGKTGIFKFDLRTGQLLKRLIPDCGRIDCMFNDLAVDSRGDVFITEINGGAIYTIRGGRDELELFLEPGTLAFPNGIAISGNDQYLYTGDLGGISRITVSTRAILKLSHPADVSLSGVDGLYFHNGCLYAVQNNWAPQRIRKFRLNQSLGAVEEARTLLAYDPRFDIPTTGAIAGDGFYILANSQLGSYNKDGTIFPYEKLKDVVILKVKL